MNCNIAPNGIAFGIPNLEELEKKACKTIELPALATINGNAIAFFTMLVLKEILKQQSANPINNLTNIIALSNSIAGLNSSIKIIQ
ncbi:MULTISPECIES: hypothetical protein [Pelosinus]|uniref:Uncharacterized protein n=1 Tax=Pelosinus fermentans B4 TaxID=1149862 RepID=I9L8C0_9FIRM|nr:MULTISPECIES: hypothetical protein [Pelosinus]MDF2636900.1 hypothetical protein [Pelosinus sp.]EIW16511.1 hypothetical protein FB4_1022 [Pelosinus fermentans B4]EIW22508.1 hypothetical protein FA11_0091 [Pelosinus fermentans A11]OAM95818.1 hypothetical protein FR7_03839 [Pelosinus fermentans DSM 17108]SDR33149.1 hypothetical protein SAMN04515679_3986 [Pelosinus fermentans]